MKILQINKFLKIKGGSEAVVSKITDILTENEDFILNIGFDNDNKLEKISNSLSLGKEQKSIIGIFKNTELVDKIISIILEYKIEKIIYHNVYHHFPILDLFRRIKKETSTVTLLFLHDYKVVCPIQTLYNYDSNSICEKCANKKFYNVIKNKCKDNSYFKSTLFALESFYNNKINDAYGNVDYIVTPSYFAKSKIEELGFSHKIDVLSNPIITKTKKVSFKENKNTIITYIGRFSKEKGILDLLSIAKKMDNVIFNFVGKGEYNDLILESAKKYKNIIHLGYKNTDELAEVYKNTTYTIVPSVWYEVFGLTILESMSYGTPVITSGYGGTKELVREEKGFIIDFINTNIAISQINNIVNISVKEYNLMQEKGFNFYLKNSDEAYYNKLKAILNKRG